MHILCSLICMNTWSLTFSIRIYLQIIECWLITKLLVFYQSPQPVTADVAFKQASASVLEFNALAKPLCSFFWGGRSSLHPTPVKGNFPKCKMSRNTQEWRGSSSGPCRQASYRTSLQGNSPKELCRCICDLILHTGKLFAVPLLGWASIFFNKIPPAESCCELISLFKIFLTFSSNGL